MRLPSGLKATLEMPLPPVSPRERTSFPVAASHTATLKLSVATMRLPSGLKATLLPEAACALRERISLPVAASHRITLFSSLDPDDPLTIRLPSGLKATPVMPEGCPLRVNRSFASCAVTGVLDSPTQVASRQMLKSYCLFIAAPFVCRQSIG